MADGSWCFASLRARASWICNHSSAASLVTQSGMGAVDHVASRADVPGYEIEETEDIRKRMHFLTASSAEELELAQIVIDPEAWITGL